MLLSILLHTRSLRFGIPAFVLVGVSPHFFSSWLVWRLLSCLFPRRVYERVDEMAYNSYQSLVTFFFETYNGTKVSTHECHKIPDQELHFPGCITCTTHAGGTPVAHQVYTNVKGCRTPEVQRSREPCIETCIL